MIASLMTGLAGLVASRVLFRRFPCLEYHPSAADAKDVSVIIPARNEALTLPHLLEDLKNQTIQPLEVICVDDDSSDDTALVAASLGARVVPAPPRPEGWLGKPWACEAGTRSSKGKHLLFLDADVRLAPDALSTLMTEYGDGHRAISVQPYHCVPKGYEQLALFFNALQFGANGAALPRPRGIGLFGPVILMSRNALETIQGFTGVCSCIVEDLALGERLRESGIEFRLLSGGRLISFRMYRDGIGSLVKGWTKNFAAGAARTPIWLFALVFLWVTGCTSAPFRLILSAVQGAWSEVALQTALYLLWVMELRRIADKLGSFRLPVIAFFPLPLGLFLWVFVQSCWKKVMKRPVQWKGRDIRWGK
ncbi:MAG: glycosyltransferase [Lentisphaerae bacterium]|nr:glycosyltransferase [Lentisphaerota bacterium]